MERTGLDSGKGKRPSSWLSDDKKHHHVEYLKRLADLRDGLIGQEKSNLAHALERLRLSSITNTDSIYRLRLRDGRSFPSPRRQMMTTSEKFRLTRPVKHRPELFPLQGKQIIEPKSNRSACSEEKCVKPTSQIDETAHFNLQRFAQPTPSIPNIGRKAGKRENLVLNTKGMNKRKYRTCAQTYFNSLSPSFSSRSGDSLELRPDSFQLQSLTLGDRLDEEKLRKFYCVYYVPSTSSTTSQQSREKSSPRLSRRQTTNSKNRQPLRQGPDRSMTSFGLSKNSSDRQTNHYRFPVVPPSENHLNQTVPSFNIQGELDRVGTDRAGTDRAGTDRAGTDRAGIDGRAMGRNVGISVQDGDQLSGRLSRRHIRVDMPLIVCNCPTPDPRELDDDGCDAGTLSKMYRQSEIRQRELQNLFEDVKELNMRTDTLTHFEQIYVDNE